MRHDVSNIVLFLLVGTLVNIAVAWGCVLSANIGPGQQWRAGEQPDDDAAQFWLVYRADQPTITMIQSGRNPDAVYGNSKKIPGSTQLLPRWAFRELHNGPQPDHRVLLACGWPFRALWCEWQYPILMQTKLVRMSGCIHLPIEPAEYGLIQVERALPLRLVWLGFALNTVFYAAILRLLVALPSMLRRRQRVEQAIACVHRSVPHERQHSPTTTALPTITAR